MTYRDEKGIGLKAADFAINIVMSVTGGYAVESISAHRFVLPNEILPQWTWLAVAGSFLGGYIASRVTARLDNFFLDKKLEEEMGFPSGSVDAIRTGPRAYLRTRRH